MFGRFLRHHPALPLLQRIYAAIWGAPFVGMRCRAAIVMPVLTSIPASHALDAGCGPGAFAVALARARPGTQVMGIDEDAALAEADGILAGRLRLPNLSFRHERVESLSDRNTYDLAFSVDSLEHIADDRAAASRLYAALRPGGTQVVHPPREGWTPLFESLRGHIVPGHVRDGYTETSLRALLEEAGFRVERMETAYGTSQAWATQAGMLLARRSPPAYALLFPLLLLVSRLPGPFRGTLRNTLLAVGRKPPDAPSGGPRTT